MDLTVKDAARLLEVSEKLIFQWIKGRGLPAYRIKNQFRINRDSMFEWPTVNGVRISPRFITSAFKAAAPALPSLSDAVNLGGIHYGIKGATVRAVLTSAVSALHLPESVQRPFLLHMLLAREAMGSTGIGEGIALPHPRNPIVLSVDKPLVSILFLEQSVDFNAIDHQPVSVFFLLISPTVRIHLHLLSRIAFVVQNAAVKELLHARAPAPQLMAALSLAENAASAPRT
ncbi:MAG TPA: PTS sugar transporter subunit IIA [Chitinivibrionales bacterium]